jgi:choline dehydrogenase
MSDSNGRRSASTAQPAKAHGRAETTLRLEDFVREGAITYWHQTCSAKMGRDAMSVVDGRPQGLWN